MTARGVAAIVLAGGGSTRMGVDKALIAVAGQPLLRRVCDVASQCCEEVYVVSPRSAQYQPLLPPACRMIQETIAAEGQPLGPLVGFAQGLAQVEQAWVLLLACDLPNLQVPILQAWIAHLPSVVPDAIACLPSHPKRWEPLCGFYRRSCLSDLQHFIDQGGRSFQVWLKSRSVQAINDFTDVNPQMLLNCNEPDDLKSVWLF
ncbi:molybdenum cofactor guanylyltransferase [Trichothermofontia sichuanensis B231]|uniref:molybdenum cofactor guanylyltransferase n=1 Tax=Trichothermofontia sichuanensis TaxID=3045816 RepID=UPI0022459D8F|nr:molybdenum cofactor guanylyltransferase [Trichothermofontia sichuanensis]UZQ54326.1 molybdenum cofactor guanylyltransferase [Trichothermofontia sichuanensis B231]